MYDGAGDQMLREVTVGVADGADAVVSFDEQTIADRMTREPDDGRIRRARAESFLAAGESKPDSRQDGEIRLVAAAQQADFRAQLRVPHPVDVNDGLRSREESVRRHAKLDAI
ncbi:MAG TPA: hypothetical protein VFP91_00515 [Vicinamibacterales bacterium]|nr:hypothetical protein [Vicinamibacterales bacterium]